MSNATPARRPRRTRLDPQMMRDFEAWGFDVHGWAKSTRKLYASRARAADRWLADRGESLLRADTRTLTRWLYQLPPTASSRNVSLQALQGFFAFLVAEGRRSSNPAAEVPFLKYRRTIPKALTREQAGAVLVAAEATGPMWLAAVSLMLHTGMRHAEARTLTWAQVNPEGWVSFIAKGGGDRVLPLHRHTLEALNSWQSQTDDPQHVFPSPVNPGRPLSTSTFRQHVLDIGDAAGLQGLHPHVLRHTLATSLVEAGVDLVSVQSVLGHRSLQTTQKYVAVRPQRLAEAIGTIDYSGAAG